MIWFSSLLLFAAAIAILDRLLLIAERRGWIRYRQSRAAFRVSAGNALSEIDGFYNPTRRHAIELTQEEILRREEEDDGDTPPEEPARAEDEGEFGAKGTDPRSASSPPPSPRADPTGTV